VIPQKLTAVFFALVCFLTSFGNTITVTSNSDNGTGSLRQAITTANANGTSVTDIILFNLPDVSVAGRRITLTSELPPLTSNISIDASTQPGNKFGVSDAKVELYFEYSAGSEVRVFKIYNCTNIGIYALKITDNITWTQWYKETICIRMENANNIQVGDVGKGNVIINWIHAIQGYANVGNNNELTYNKNISIYSNFFNVDDDGETAIGDGDLVVFNRIENINVGNLDPRSGNILSATRKRILITGTKGNILVANNKVGTNYTGTKVLSKPYGEGTQVFDNIRISNSSYAYEIEYNTDVKVINNLSTGYCNAGIYIVGIGKKIYVQGNKIGTDITGKKKLTSSMDYGIWITNCRSAIIGVENDEEKERNIIAFSKPTYGATGSHGIGIVIYCPSGITVSRNSIFCNGEGSIGQVKGSAYIIPVVTINNITATSISGTAPPLSKIEMFRDDTCNNCELKTYFDLTYADANGNWSKNNINATNVVVTATDTAGMTSEESGAKIEFKNFTVKDATCGKNNGSISGINITSGTWWQWEDDKGNIVGHDSVLKNIGPGDYRLVVGIGFHSCTLRTDLYHVNNITLPASVTPVINAASCGRNNGSISVNYDNYTYNGNWYNEANQYVGTGSNLQNALPGKYTLELDVLKDGSCNKTFGPFTITNSSGPSLDISDMRIIPATCGQKNGSIVGGNILNGAPGGVHTLWFDTLDRQVGMALNLQNVYGGRYKMKIKDNSGCDTIITPYFTIPSKGDITIDSSNMVIQPAKCSGEGGSIDKLVIGGGDTYDWKSISTGDIVSRAVNAFNLAAGKYELYIGNSFGCIKTVTVTVPQASFNPIAISGFSPRLASCGLTNGSLQPLIFSQDTSLYSFIWINSANNQVVSHYTNAFGLAGGNYSLYAKDNNGCEKMIYTAVVNEAPLPSFDYTGMRVLPDNCLSGKGNIKGIKVNNLAAGTPHYIWLNSADDSIGNAINIDGLVVGDYQLKLTDALGCSIISKPVRIDNVNTSLPPPQYDDQVILKNTRAILTVKNKQPGTYEIYEDPLSAPVQTNLTGTFITAALGSDKTYFVRFVSGVCTSAFVPVVIKVVDKITVYVPNAFTPNADGKNDVFKPVIFGPIKLKYFSVYNRWGQRVFSSTEAEKGWNGKFNGQLPDSGVFIWILSAINELTGEHINEKGTVMLVR
jgi:gliding motility-associated-like protein